MPRYKPQQTLNINHLQDFVLNERNIENILKNILTVSVDTINLSDKRQPKPVEIPDELFLLPRFTDTLFWCYFIINNGLAAYEIIHGDGFKDSMREKIQLVEQVRENKELLKQNKWKHRYIEDELVNQKTISLSAFICICAIKKHNIVYIDGRKLFTFIKNMDTTKLNIIKKTEHGFSLFIGDSAEEQNKYQFYKDNYWHIENLNKPLRGISNYKIKNLRDICSKLKIDVNDNKTPKKKTILYQLIQEHL